MDFIDAVSHSTAQPVSPSTSSREDKKVTEASQGFEAYFIQQMLQEMRKTIPKTERPGFGSAIYESMMDQALAQNMSEHSGIGLAKQIRETLEARNKK
ncbi:MAG: rod-binding protein [Nitrospirae bacterium]|nr:rod-binding protein [Nitrospirota bacterium]